MELRIDRDMLFRAVSRIQSIIEKRSNMPILSAVLLSAEEGGILLSATDLEISFQQKQFGSESSREQSARWSESDWFYFD